MFTGVIEITGNIQKLMDNRLAIEAPEIVSALKKGSSVAVDGACLTVTELSSGTFTVDFMPETAQKTIVLGYNVGDLVNLELPMPANGRFEGHMVTGHVDSLAEVVEVKPDGNAQLLTIKIPDDLERYLIPKGSIAINGISLTVIDVQNDHCTVGIIPHTWERTNLHGLRVGDKVNIEMDVLAKHIEKLVTK